MKMDMLRFWCEERRLKVPTEDEKPTKATFAALLHQDDVKKEEERAVKEKGRALPPSTMHPSSTHAPSTVPTSPDAKSPGTRKRRSSQAKLYESRRDGKKRGDVPLDTTNIDLG
eukprot:TRINITY_DN11081_c0_g1_i2.p2 TRINITY_DN11081_c0_g1~~TRINITY_DN11081_c0_g1_i2.p2  ORF type:complete len:114 (+),score=21.44 TRINITY_DN11081_c0_g1_i2:373-714(+)